jgi:hypothetical protein
VPSENGDRAGSWRVDEAAASLEMGAERARIGRARQESRIDGEQRVDQIGEMLPLGDVYFAGLPGEADILPELCSGTRSASS